MKNMLKDAYAREIEERGGIPDFDEDTVSRIVKVASWLASETAKPMLLLYGGVGNGKTTMAKAVKRMSDTIQYVAMRNMDSLMNEVRCPIFRTAQELAATAASNSEQFYRLATCKFLIIDDFGCEPVAVKNWGTEITPITDVLYRRYETMSPTIVTTNLTMNDIRSRYGDRLADRFIEAFDMIGYTNASYRK